MIQDNYVPLWGEDLVTLRHAAGLTQAQLAARAEVGRRAVSYWERKSIVDLLQPMPARILAALLAVKYRARSPELLDTLAIARACASWALTARRAQGSAGTGSKGGPLEAPGAQLVRARARPAVCSPSRVASAAGSTAG